MNTNAHSHMHPSSWRPPTQLSQLSLARLKIDCSQLLITAEQQRGALTLHLSLANVMYSVCVCVCGGAFGERDTMTTES